MKSRTALKRVASLLGCAAGLAMAGTVWALPADPDLDNWKDDKNNCYNYALNRHSNDYKQPGGVQQGPGRGRNWSGQEWCDKIKARAEGDGLKKLDGGENDPIPTPGPDSNLVALATLAGTKGIDGDGDYHWFRKNGDGSWSHKPGGDKAQSTYHKDATNTDEAMTDPRVKDQRDGYATFCGWYAVPKSLALSPGQPKDPPQDGCLIITLLKSGLENPTCTLRGASLDGLRQHLPTLSVGNMAPDPHWVVPDAGEPRGFGIEAGPLALGFPPYLKVYRGVVAVYADIQGGQIDYFYDDRGLEPYLETQGFSVPGANPWSTAALTLALLVAGAALLRGRRVEAAAIE